MKMLQRCRHVLDPVEFGYKGRMNMIKQYIVHSTVRKMLWCYRRTEIVSVNRVRDITLNVNGARVWDRCVDLPVALSLALASP